MLAGSSLIKRYRLSIRVAAEEAQVRGEKDEVVADKVGSVWLPISPEKFFLSLRCKDTVMYV